MSETVANYNALRRAARDAINARDEIDNCSSPEWLAAHRAATVACNVADAEMKRLAKADRYGAWRGPAEREMMLCGVL